MIIVGSGTTLQWHDGSALLSAAGEVANSIVHPTDPEWNPLDILYLLYIKYIRHNNVLLQCSELCLLFWKRCFSTVLAGFLAIIIVKMWTL